jgi:putative transposase
MKYQRIVLLKEEGHTVKMCCDLLKVSSSSFYDWLGRKPSAKKERDKCLREKIVKIFKNSKKNYGSPRVQKALQRSGEKIGKDKVAKLMKEEGISAKKKKAFQPKTTINNPTLKKSERIFKIEETVVTGPNQVWVSDLTYLSGSDGFSYLVTVIDLFNREVKGWDISDSMEASNTKAALLEAIRKTTGPLSKLVFHSDQGIQYCSKDVRDKLNLLNITQSMSRKGNCYDNAFAEIFFGSLQNEMELDHFSGLEEANKEVTKYINWYNFERLHSSLGYLSPVEYSLENNLAA